MFWLTIFLIKIWIRLTCRVDTTVLQKVPMDGPLIVITNHTGQIEVPIMFAYLQPRKLTAWAKAEAWDNKFLNYIFR